jgi:hypothetical protein
MASVPEFYFRFFQMAGGNEAQRSDRMELPKHLDECEHHVFRRVKAVTALPCTIFVLKRFDF